MYIEGMLDVLNEMNSVGWYTIIVSIILTILLIPLAKTGIEKFKEAMGWTDKRAIEKENLEKRLQDIEKRISDVDKRVTDTSNMYDTKLDSFHQQSIQIRGELADDIISVKESQNEIKSSLLDLKNIMIDDKVDTIRWEILAFASKVIYGEQNHNKEQYDHVLDIYEKYEKILEENGLENGRVDMSMSFVKKKYAELMENGFNQ